MSGHNGEWFSTAVAAYSALKHHQYETESQDLTRSITSELRRELNLFQEIYESGKGLEILKAATIIGHNVGDLNRVIGIWELPDDDFLNVSLHEFYHSDKRRHFKLLETIQNLNRDIMADENHRHFALRKPKALRQSAKLFLPIGPFFDDWGKVLAACGLLSSADLGEVIEALVDGWMRLEDTVGYARALVGIIENATGGMKELTPHIPARTARTLQSGRLRSLMSIPQQRFEAQWHHTALKNLGTVTFNKSLIR